MKNYILLNIILFILILYSCKKDLTTVQKNSADHSSSLIDSFKTDFYKKNYGTKLNQKLNDTLNLSWEPDWKNYTQSNLGDSLTYYFVALNPVAINSKKNESPSIQEANIKRFIVIGKSATRTFYRISTYLFDTKNTGNTISAIGKNYNLQSFTGSILYENLDIKTFNMLKYTNGVKANTVSTNKSTSSTLKTNYIVTECTTYATCTYYGFCNNELTITYVSGIDFCPSSPYWNPCYGTNWTGWTYSRTDYDTACQDVEYPDPPVGGPIGTGPGGVTTNQDRSTVAFLSQKVGVDCAGIPLVNTISSSPFLQNKNNEIRVNTSNSGNEYGYEVKLSTNGSNLFVNIPVRTDGQPDSFVADFTWEFYSGWTVGASHGHPTGTTLSPEDVEWLLTNLSRPSLANAGASAIKLYKEHAFVTAVTQDATYTVTVTNWDDLRDMMAYFKGPGGGGLDAVYRVYAQAYLQQHPLATSGEMTESALLNMFTGSINLYKQAANSSAYVLIQSDGLFKNTHVGNCP